MKRFLTAILAVIALASCEYRIPLGPKPVPVPPVFSIDREVLDSVRSSGMTVKVSFTSNKAWEARSNATWITVFPEKGDGGRDAVEMEVTVSRHTGESGRVGSLTIKQLLDSELDEDFDPIVKNVIVFQQKKQPKQPGRGITDMEDWEDFCKACNNSQSLIQWMRGDTLELHCDLDMSEFTSTFQPISNFKGVFLGNSHKIFNWNIKPTEGTMCGLFTQFVGKTTVKDLYLGTKDGVSYDGISCIQAAIPAPSTSDHAYAGALVGITSTYNDHYQVDLENIYNFVKVQSATKDLLRIGGIAGLARSATLRNCHNFGDVEYTLDGNTSTRFSSIGGVVGFFADSNNHPAEMYDCSNSGNVLVSGIGCNHIGGVVGCQGDAKVIYKNVVNYGEVKVTRNLGAVKDKRQSIGGVVGFLRLAEMENCSNEGDVKYDIVKWGSTSSLPFYIGGVVGASDERPVKLIGCSNKGEVYMYMFYQDSGKPTSANIGGIIGKVHGNGNAESETALVEGCTNSGYVHSIHPKDSRLGGIAGLAIHAVIRDCRNSGWVSLEYTEPVEAMSTAGGIVGFLDWPDGKKSDKGLVTGCVNEAEGKVLATFKSTLPYLFGDSTTAGGTVGGGIVGLQDCGAVENNVNHAPVLAENSCSDDTAAAYAGGVVGLIYEDAKKVEGNTNNGSVTARAASSKKENSYAGGVAAINMVAAVTDNTNTGTVVSLYGDSYSLPGNASDQVAYQK